MVVGRCGWLAQPDRGPGGGSQEDLAKAAPDWAQEYKRTSGYELAKLLLRCDRTGFESLPRDHGTMVLFRRPLVSV